MLTNLATKANHYYVIPKNIVASKKETANGEWNMYGLECTCSCQGEPSTNAAENQWLLTANTKHQSIHTSFDFTY